MHIVGQGHSMKKAEDYYLNVIYTKVLLLMLIVSDACSYIEKQLFCLF